MTTFENRSLAVQMQIRLRLAQKDDLPKLEWYGQYQHYRQLFHRAYTEQMRGRRLMLLADCNNFPIGHIFIQLNSANTRIADGHSRAYLYAFRVMEMFRGQGIGTQMINEAENILLDRGFSRATIAVAKDNPRAQKLYKRLNYVIIGDDPGQWTYVDHNGLVNHVDEPCWVLEKKFNMG